MVSRSDEFNFPESKPNPSQSRFDDPNLNANSNSNSFNKLKLRVPMERRYPSLAPSCLALSFHSPFCRYYANTNGVHWPPEVQDYNKRFTKMLEHIKSRHDPTVTTVAQGVLEWKRSQNARNIGLDIQAWLDRFYLSRIGIRFLIGQRAFFFFFFWVFNPIYSNSYPDVAINTHQAHEDFVGIICTQAVRPSLLHPSLIQSILPIECPRYSHRSNRKRPFCLRRTLRNVQRPTCPAHLSSKPHVPLCSRSFVSHLF